MENKIYIRRLSLAILSLGLFFTFCLVHPQVKRSHSFISHSLSN